MSLLFASVLIAVLLTLSWRALRRRSAERKRPGGRPETAIVVHDFGDIDMVTRRQICPCGGPFALLGEGPMELDGHSLRMVTLVCGHCERERRLYFDLTEIRH